MILDAGVLIAIDRGEPYAKNFLQAALNESAPLRTTAPVAAQVMRDGSKQARLSSFVRSVEVRSFTAADVRDVGRLLRVAKTSDVVDAHLTLFAIQTNDSIVTGDSRDFSDLVAQLGRSAPPIRHWK